MIYTATVSYLVSSKRDYLRRVKTVRNIAADSITEASHIALSQVKNQICPAVSSIWYDWPQSNT